MPTPTPKRTPAAPAPGSTSNSLMRGVAPFAPLALALLASHSGLTNSTPAPTPTPTTTAATSESKIKRNASSAPAPLLETGKPVDWWFVFKFNANTFPGCGSAKPACPFGGTVQNYGHFGQQFAMASSADPALRQGTGCVGDTTADPVGATFSQVYNGQSHYVVWNDQFYGDPMPSKSSPAGHSKGMLAWDDSGAGFVLQVSTPSWPASASAANPRTSDGNSLGCVKDNDVLVSQHFFALKLNKADVIAVLNGLQNASIVTDPTKPEIVNNGGPPEIQAIVSSLGTNSRSRTATTAALSTGVTLISKPSALQVPPWQMVSSLLNSEPLRVATWWSRPEIPSTTAASSIGCWDSSLTHKPGAIDIATSGTWSGKTIGLEGMAEPDGNHAKIGVSSTATHSLVIFGDMNQQGSLNGPKCDSSQNGRGGLFYVLDSTKLADDVRALLKGDSAAN